MVRALLYLFLCPWFPWAGPWSAFGLTAVDTLITSRSTARYERHGERIGVISNQVRNRVGACYGVALSPSGSVTTPSRSSSVVPGATAHHSYTLRNTGNAPDSYRLQLVRLPEGDAFEPASCRVLLDTNSNHRPDPGEIRSATDPTPLLRPGETVHLIVMVTVPVSARPGQCVFLDLQAESVECPGVRDCGNVSQTLATADASVLLDVVPSSSHVYPGTEVAYTLSASSVGGAPARGLVLSLDGEDIHGALLSGAMPGDRDCGARYVLESVAASARVAVPVVSFDHGASWYRLPVVDAGDCQERVTDVGLVLPGENGLMPPGERVSLQYRVRVDPDRAPGPLSGAATLRYRNQAGEPQQARAVSTVFVRARPGAGKILIGPCQAPGRTGDHDLNGDGLTDTNDDCTEHPGVPVDDPSMHGTQIAGNSVLFLNTVRNASTCIDTISLSLDPLTDLPPDWTVQILQVSGVRSVLASDGHDPSTAAPPGLAAGHTVEHTALLSDSDADGLPDTGPLAPGEELTLGVRVQIPAHAPTADRQGHGFRTVVRASSTTDPATSDLTTNLIRRTVALAEVWTPFTNAQAPVAPAGAADPIRYTHTVGNHGPGPVHNAVVRNRLSPYLEAVHDVVSGLVPDLGRSGVSVVVTGRYDPVAHAVVWQIPELPAGFTGRLGFRAGITPGAPAGHEIGNAFTVTSDQTEAVYTSNRVTCIADSHALIALRKRANLQRAAVGDPVLYTVEVENRAPYPLDSLVLHDLLPCGLAYRPGSALVNGIAAGPAVVASAVPVPLLSWSPGRLEPGENQTLTYVCVVGSGTVPGLAVNTVTATGATPGGAPVSVQACAELEVVEEAVFSERSLVFGKVFVDTDRNGTQDPGEPGVGDVRLYLEDGRFVFTDPDGMYHFPAVAPGVHVLRLDETTLPSDGTLEPVVVDTQNAGNPRSRYLDLSRGLPHRANFRLVPAAAAPPAPAAPLDAAIPVLRPETPAEAGDDSRERPPRILSPVEGDAFSDRSQIDVCVACHLAAEFRLFVNDEPVSEERIGTRKLDVRQHLAEYTYIAVPLAPGRNCIRFQALNPGFTRSESVTISVLRAGEPVAVKVQVTPEHPMADARTEPVVCVNLLDANGVPAAEGSVVHVAVDRGRILGRDLHPTERGHQVQVRGGRAEVRLSAARHPETRTVIVRAGRLEHRTELQFRPHLRDWIVNGIVAASATHNSAANPAHSDQAPGVDVDDRTAVFLKGTLPWETTLTASYDSDHDRAAERSFEPEDALAHHPVCGDDCGRGSEAGSRERLYLRLEHDRSHVLYGDFETDLGQHNSLAVYDRRLTGAQAHVEGRFVDVDAFAARSDWTAVRTEIQGRGVSGYYRLPDAHIVRNSERVVLETRDRYHPDTVLTVESLERHRDYSIDYDTGRLLFRRPIPSRDRDRNPVFIVVRYEADGDRGSDYITHGNRIAVHNREGSLELGVTQVVDGNTPADHTIQGIDATWAIREGLELHGEYAATRSPSRDRDNALRLELAGARDRAEFRVYGLDIGQAFDNPSMRGDPVGRARTGVEAVFRLRDHTRLETEAFLEHDREQGEQRVLMTQDLVREQGRLSLLAGVGYVQEKTADNGDGRVAQAGLLRLGTGLRVSDRVHLDAGHQQAFGAVTREQSTRSDLALTYGHSPDTAFRLGVEQRRVRDHGTDLGVTAGVESRLTPFLSGFHRYALDTGAGGLCLRTGAGLEGDVPVTPELRLNAALEVGRALRAGGSTTADDSRALSVGFTYRPTGTDHTAAGRFEVQDQHARTAWLMELGGTLRLGQDHTVFARDVVTLTVSRDATRGGRRNAWTVDTLTGWAYRPVASDRFVLVSDVELAFDTGTVVTSHEPLNRVILSTEAHWQPGGRLALDGRYAVKHVTAAYTGSTCTDVKALGLRFDLHDRVFVTAGGRWLSQYGERRGELGYGLGLGVNLARDLRVKLGFNFEGVNDRELERGEPWTRGVYVQVHWKFDESILGILARLEEDEG